MSATPPRPDRGAGRPVRAAAGPGEAALELRGLTKRFGQTYAVAAISLTVPRGSFFGLVGPNGAGKTTTLRMATGLLRPDAGTALLQGIDIWRRPVDAKRIIGVVPEELQLFDRLTGSELLTYNGLLRGMDPEVVRARSLELRSVLGLSDAADTLVVDYSHGMKKKIALACALLHAPRLLFLDEPFEGIDPVSAHAIRTVLERHVRVGATVVFSSHVMEVVERLCDRVAIIDRGHIVADGTLDDVRAGVSLEERFVRLVGGVTATDGTLAWLDSSSG